MPWTTPARFFDTPFCHPPSFFPSSLWRVFFTTQNIPRALGANTHTHVLIWHASCTVSTQCAASLIPYTSYCFNYFLCACFHIGECSHWWNSSKKGCVSQCENAQYIFILPCMSAHSQLNYTHPNTTISSNMCFKVFLYQSAWWNIKFFETI